MSSQLYCLRWAVVWTWHLHLYKQKRAATVCNGNKHVFFPRVACYAQLFICFSRRPNLYIYATKCDINTRMCARLVYYNVPWSQNQLSVLAFESFARRSYLICNNTKRHNGRNKMSSTKRKKFRIKKKKRINFHIVMSTLCNLQFQLIQFYIFDARYYLNELIVNERGRGEKLHNIEIMNCQATIIPMRLADKGSLHNVRRRQNRSAPLDSSRVLAKR